MKRAMAGEYSRELSVKVFTGQCRLIRLGFRQGGAAGFGLRRYLVDEHRQPKAVLNQGEQKSLQTDRVVLRPGRSEEHTSELQSLMSISYAVLCWNKKNTTNRTQIVLS